MKKIALITSSAALIAMSVASFAFAQADPGTPQAPASQPVVSVHIDYKGNAMLRGVVASISGNTVNVSSWGGNWAVDASQATIVRRYNGKSSVAEIQVGDSVQVWGTASQSGLSIAAKRIKDFSIEEKYPRYGTISNPANNAFTLTTAKGVPYAVTLSPGAKIYVDGRLTVFSDLVSGMKARVNGTVDRTNTNIAADTVRAQTIPYPKPAPSSSTAPQQ